MVFKDYTQRGLRNVDLTYMQRVALRGDIGKLIMTVCKNAEDDPFTCFMCLTIYGSDYYKEVLDILKETFQEEDVNRMYYYVQSRIIPYTIWTDKVIADFKVMVDGCLDPSDTSVVRSIFCNYVYRVQEVSVYACHVLLNAVLKNEEMEVLHKDAFYLNNNIPFPEEVKIGDERPSEEEVEAKFYSDARIFGIAVAGTDVLSITDLVGIAGATGSTSSNYSNFGIDGIEEDDELVKGETSEDIYENLLERYKDVKEGTYFIVRKKELATGEIISTRNFVSIKDVVHYLRTTTENSPEVSQKYQFVIMEVENGLN